MNRLAVLEAEADVLIVARALRITGSAPARIVAWQALNGYRYQIRKLARVLGVVLAFRALQDGAL